LSNLQSRQRQGELTTFWSEETLFSANQVQVAQPALSLASTPSTGFVWRFEIALSLCLGATKAIRLLILLG
jgi:hypothetical protein